MKCPACQSENCRRSRRRSLLDHVFGIASVVPWRCAVCETRFHARPIPFSHLLYAHCSICGNLELKRISPDYVPGVLSGFWRLLGLPSLRCEPCRNKFFSVRPVRKFEPDHREREPHHEPREQEAEAPASQL